MHTNLSFLLSRKLTLVAALAGVTAVAGYGSPVHSRAALTSAPSAATPLGSGPLSSPALPHAFELPPTPIVAGTSVGYLPGSGSVTPTGDFSWSMPLEIPPGRAGMQPALALSYSSGAGNGLLGMGFGISGFSTITRCGKSIATEGEVDGVDFDGGDRFCLDGEKLMLVAPVSPASPNQIQVYGGEGTEYRTEADSFARVVALDVDERGPAKFKVYRKSGSIQTFEAVTADRIEGHYAGPMFMGQVRAYWVIRLEEDRAGNQISYEYQTELTWNVNQAGSLIETVPKRIHYTSHSKGTPSQRYIEFAYASRPDTRVRWSAGVGTRSSKRVESVTMYAPNPTKTSPVWTYHFDYLQASGTGRSLLTQVKRCAAGGQCLWSKDFEWNDGHPVTGFELVKTVDAPLSLPSVAPNAERYAPVIRVADFNGDGGDDVLMQQGGDGAGDFNEPHKLYLSAPGPSGTQMFKKTETLSRSGPGYGPVYLEASFPLDVNHDGVSELMAYASNGSYTARHWNGVKFDVIATALDEPPFADMNGDSLLEQLPKTAPVYAEWPDSPDDVDCGEPNQLVPSLRFGEADDPSTWVPAQCPAEFVDSDGDGRQELFTRQVVEIPSGQCNHDGQLGTPALPKKRWVCLGDYIRAFENDQGVIQTEIKYPLGGMAGDFNGDGLTDSLVRSPAVIDGTRKYTIAWNTGNGYYKNAVTQVVPVDELSNNVIFADDGYRVVDINDDGMADLVGFQNGPNDTAPKLNLLISKGNGQFDHQTLSFTTPGTRLDVVRETDDTPTSPVINWADNPLGEEIENHTVETGPMPTEVAAGWLLSTFGDFDGDGRLDILRHTKVSGAGKFEVYSMGAGQPSETLARVYDEPTDWAREEVTYDTEWSADPEHKFDDLSCWFPLTCVRQGFPVVRTYTSRAHLVNPTPSETVSKARTLHYSYEDPIGHRQGRGDLGFGKVRVWDPTALIETETTYDHRKHEENFRYFPYADVPKTQTTITPILTSAQMQNPPAQAKARISVTTSDTEFRLLNKDQTYAVFPKETTRVIYEGMVEIDMGALEAANTEDRHLWNPDPPINQVETTSTSVVDDYGNVTQQTMQNTQVGVMNGAMNIVAIQFENRLEEWLIGLPIDTTVSSTVKGVTVTRHSTAQFDALGRLERADIEPGNADPSLTSWSSFTYDSIYGLLTSTTVQGSAFAGPRTSRAEYGVSYPGAPDEKVFPSQVWADHDAVNQPACDLKDCRPSEWFITHPALGVAIASMDVNGVQTTGTYDSFGRLLTRQVGGELPVAMSYSGRPDAGLAFCSPNPCYNGLIVDATVGLQASRVVVGGLGQTLTSSRTGFDGDWIHSSLEYDILGRVVAASRPYTTGNLPTDFSTVEYDSLGRVLKTLTPDQKATTHKYLSLFESETVDPLNHKSYIKTDVDGNIVESGNVLLKPGFANPFQNVSTLFRYGPFGRLEKVIDPEGNESSVQYDSLGRRRQMTDPDRGITEFSYTSFGELHEQSALGIGQQLRWLYDDLGRVYDEYKVGGAEGHRWFVWDESQNGVGQLAYAWGFDGFKTEYAYDTHGRLSHETLTDSVKGWNFTTNLAYDNQGRLDTLTYPAVIESNNAPRLAVKYEYDDATGHLSAIRNATPGQPADPFMTIAARNLDMALVEGTLGHGQGQIDLMRDFDSVTGRLKSMTAKTAALPDLLDIDYTYWANGLVKSRITQMSTSQRFEAFEYDTLGRLTKWNEGMGAPGYLPSPTEYRYDAIGNLTQILKNGALIEDRKYGLGGTQPHTLTQITNASSQTSKTYQYDALGRMFADPSRQITYTSFDLPKTMTVDGADWTFRYDALGRRITKSKAGGENTFYVPGLMERRETSAGVHYVYHIEGPDGTAAQVDYDVGTAATSIFYPLDDALGSVGQVIDQNGQVKESYGFDPFGQRTWTQVLYREKVTHEGFAGHEHDDALGLINMKGRMYDPAMKRFLTADSIISAPGFSQDWNLYSYAWNSPLNVTDPSGLMECPAEHMCIHVEKKGPNGNGYGAIDIWEHDTWKAKKQDSKSGRSVKKTKRKPLFPPHVTVEYVDAPKPVTIVSGPQPDMVLPRWSNPPKKGDDYTAIGSLANHSEICGELSHVWGNYGPYTCTSEARSREENTAYFYTSAIGIGAIMATRPSRQLNAPTGTPNRSEYYKGPVVNNSPLFRPEDMGGPWMMIGRRHFFWAGPGYEVFSDFSVPGVLELSIKAQAGAAVRGKTMFDAAIAAHGRNKIDAILGTWVDGDNLARVNELTSRGMPLPEAVTKTWTARQAQRHGFTQSEVVKEVGEAGRYEAVVVEFRRAVGIE